MPTVNISISDDILHTLNENEAELAHTMKVYTAMQLFRESKLSLGQAAKLAGMYKIEFMQECGRHEIPVIDYDSSELQEELKSF